MPVIPAVSKFKMLSTITYLKFHYQQCNIVSENDGGIVIEHSSSNRMNQNVSAPQATKPDEKDKINDSSVLMRVEFEERCAVEILSIVLI